MIYFQITHNFTPLPPNGKGVEIVVTSSLYLDILLTLGSNFPIVPFNVSKDLNALQTSNLNHPTSPLPPVPTEILFNLNSRIDVDFIQRVANQ